MRRSRRSGWAARDHLTLRRGHFAAAAAIPGDDTAFATLTLSMVHDFAVLIASTLPHGGGSRSLKARQDLVSPVGGTLGPAEPATLTGCAALVLTLYVRMTRAYIEALPERVRGVTSISICQQRGERTPAVLTDAAPDVAVLLTLGRWQCHESMLLYGATNGLIVPPTS